MPEPEARRELRHFAGSQFDPQIVDALIEVLDRQQAPTVESPR
jgi:response regulator RpfG family c-di-GMP phosphodiesterase